MTVSATGNRFSYAGNGVTTAFSFPRFYLAKSDIKVYLVDDTTEVATLQTLNTHYTLSSPGASGTVTFGSAPASGKTVLIYRETSRLQGLDLTDVTTMPRNTLEAALDRAMAVIDELVTLHERTVRLAASDTTSLAALPIPATRASKYVGFDTDGVLSMLTGSGTATDSALIEHDAGLDDAVVGALRSKLKNDLLTVWDFMSAEMRASPMTVDCLPALQAYIDYLYSQNSGESYKYARLLGNVPMLISDTLVMAGLADRNGYVILCDGGLIASEDWPDQTAGQVPMVFFGQDSANSGAIGVMFDCNGYAAGGICIDPAIQAQQILVTRCKIKNYHNPAFPLQEDLYDNCVTVSTPGGDHEYSAVAARRYWNADGHKSPYGIRVGKLDTSLSDFSSSSSKIYDNDIRQWDRDRDESNQFRYSTGIGIWLESSDAKVERNKTIRSNLKAILVGEGNHNEIIGNHISPYNSYTTGYKPTATQFVLGIEDAGDGTVIALNYHECMLWKENGSGKIIANMFPRGGEFSDGNNAAITFNAWEAGADWGNSDNCVIEGNTFAVDYISGANSPIKFREADSNTFTWTPGPDVAQLQQNFLGGHIGAYRYINLSNQEEVVEYLSNHATRSTVRARGRAGGSAAVDVDWGNMAGKFGAAIGSTDVFEAGTGGFGYPAGEGLGGTVTQATSKTTAVDLNKIMGQITTHAANLATGARVQFALNNTTIGQHDTVFLWRKSGGTNASYEIYVDRVDAGIAVCRIENISGGDLAEALVLGFMVIKGAIT